MFYGGIKGTIQIVIVSLFLLIASLTVLLRLVVRAVKLKSVGVDDGFICAALLASGAYMSMIVLQVRHGQGRKSSELPPGELVDLNHTLYTSIPIYLTALTLTKLSILFLYLRFFPGIKIRRFIIGLIVVFSIYGCAAVCMTSFMCTPVSHFWNLSQPGTCLDRELVWFLNATVSLVTDVICLILPMPVLSRLNLPKRQRLELMAVFAFGATACIVSIVRLHALYIIASSRDTARDNGSAAVMSSLEINVGIICSSLPSLRSSGVRVMHRIQARWHDCRKDRGSCVSHVAEEMASLPNEDLSPVMPRSGILRSVTTTITTKDEQYDSSMKPSLDLYDKIWDGGGTSSWVATNRRETISTMT